MSTLTVGSAVAVTTPQEEMLQKMIGVPATYGRGEVLGVVPVPDNLLSGDAEVDAGIEAYVIDPREQDGSPAIGVDPDWAYVIARHPQAQQEVNHPLAGTLPSAIIVERVSKSEFIATLETQHSAVVDQFRAELADDLNLLAFAQDDDDKPEFLD